MPSCLTCTCQRSAKCNRAGPAVAVVPPLQQKRLATQAVPINPVGALPESFQFCVERNPSHGVRRLRALILFHNPYAHTLLVPHQCCKVHFIGMLFMQQNRRINLALPLPPKKKERKKARLTPQPLSGTHTQIHTHFFLLILLSFFCQHFLLH